MLECMCFNLNVKSGQLNVAHQLSDVMTGYTYVDLYWRGPKSMDDFGTIS